MERLGGGGTRPVPKFLRLDLNSVEACEELDRLLGVLRELDGLIAFYEFGGGVEQ
jgi:hypothetical protein